MKRLDEITIADLMPDSISRDEQVSAASRAIDPQLGLISEAVDRPLILPAIDDLSAGVLEHLAVQYDVTAWDSAWPIDTKRAVLKTAIADKRKKGTRGAVERAIEAVAPIATLTEWWQDTSEDMPPHTFKVDLLQDGSAVDPETQANVISQVDEAKPVRSHYTFKVGQLLGGELYFAGVLRAISYARVRSAGTSVEQTSIDAGVLATMRGMSIRRLLASTHMGDMPEPEPPAPSYTEIDLFQESGAYINGYVTKSYMPGLSNSNYVYDKDGDTDPSGWSSDNYYYWDFSKRYEFGRYSGDTWIPYAQSLADMPASSTNVPSESVMIRCPSGTNLVYWGRSLDQSNSSSLKTFKCRIYDDAFSVWQNSEHTDQYPWSSGLVTDIPYDSTKIYKILCMLNASGSPVNFTYLYRIEFSNSNGFLKIDISGSGTSERFAKFVFYTKQLPTVTKLGIFGDNNWLSTSSGIAENISAGGTSSNLEYDVSGTSVSPNYDSSKSYGIIQWQEIEGTTAGRTEFNIINSNGKFKVENNTYSSLSFYQAQIAVCSSSDATIVTVYDSNGNAFNAFKFVDGVGYYYVLDGIQTDWTDDLSSIGYSDVKPIPPGSYIEVTVFLVPSSTVTFSANDYWSGVVPYNSSTYQDLIDFGVNINYDGDYRISSNNPGFTFEPLGLFNGSTDLQADMSNFYCAPGPSTSSQYENYMCIWSREAYNTPADKWKCRITKNT